jgi:response regulator of citrate/malate metabolism
MITGAQGLGAAGGSITVLVVEDEPIAAQAHREYVERVPGFDVAAVVHSGGDAMRFLQQRRVDLVLLDFYLPDTHGLALVRALRAAGNPVDVIAVTSARDLGVVKAAVSAGIVQYLLKPFTFASLRDKLESYARYRESFGAGQAVADQSAIDRALGTLRTVEHAALPKGMSGETLDAITAALREADDGLSATAVAEQVGVARVTARRYLEYLADNGLAERRPHYGQVGRPELRYRAAQ